MDPVAFSLYFSISNEHYYLLLITYSLNVLVVLEPLGVLGTHDHAVAYINYTNFNIIYRNYCYAIF